MIEIVKIFLIECNIVFVSIIFYHNKFIINDCVLLKAIYFVLKVAKLNFSVARISCKNKSSFIFLIFKSIVHL